MSQDVTWLSNAIYDGLFVFNGLRWESNAIYDGLFVFNGLRWESNAIYNGLFVFNGLRWESNAIYDGLFVFNGLGWESNAIYVGLFVFNGLGWEVVVPFVDIGGILFAISYHIHLYYVCRPKQDYKRTITGAFIRTWDCSVFFLTRYRYKDKPYNLLAFSV
jgi:hypothetical protein